jgi:hypothetical protein
MTSPTSFLPPASQPWGRWVENTLRNILNSRERVSRDVQNSLRQLNVAIPQPMRGAIWRQTSGTVTITTANTYVPMNLAGTLDTDVSFNMSLSGAPNVTGLKNTTDQTRTMVIIATYDGKGGNNEAVGLGLALNNVFLPETECTSFGGSTGQVAKTLTQWILKLEPGDEVTMWAANKDTTVNLTIDRFKMIAHAIP